MKIRVGEYISQIEAINLLLDLALHSNYIPLDGPELTTIPAVASYLAAKGLSIPKCASEIVKYTEKPKYFYNLIGATYQVRGAKISRVDLETGHEKQILSGDGQYNEANYWAKFDQAQIDYERAIDDVNHELLFSSFSKGQAAVENYLNVLPVAGIKDKSVEGKLKSAYLVKKRKADWNDVRGTQPWSTFLELKQIRNKQEVHNKSEASGFTYEEIFDHFRIFPIAISQLLLRLHKLWGMRCPASIVRASYFPDLHLETDT